MPVNLLALCKTNGALAVKRVRVSAEVQGQLEGVFIQQEQTFLEGITEEIAFDGGWKPEPNEMLTLPVTPEIQAVFAEAQQDVLALPDLDPHAITAEGVKGLGVLVQRQNQPQLLLQSFDARQILQQRFSLILNGATFNHLTAPAFSIANGLAGIVDAGHVRFRSFSKIRLIFSLKHLYIEATDAQVDAFSGHGSLHVADAAAFREQADQGVRKLVHAISHRGTLDNFTTHQIGTAAENEGLVIEIVNERIVVPTQRPDLKRLLAFLDDGYYRAALSGIPYITNSKRAAN